MVGLQGPEYLGWLAEAPERDYTILMGANTYRLMSEMGGETSDEEARAILKGAHELMRGAVEGAPERRAVYRRAGHGCRRCGTPIESRGQGEQSRTAYWCSGCQL